MIAELGNIVLDVDLPSHGLLTGDIGTVVLVHVQAGYEVDFVRLNDETVGVVSMTSGHVPPVADGEIAHGPRVGAM